MISVHPNARKPLARDELQEILPLPCESSCQLAGSTEHSGIILRARRAHKPFFLEHGGQQDHLKPLQMFQKLTVEPK